MNNLPKVVAQQRRGRASNPRLLDRKSDALPLSHRATREVVMFSVMLVCGCVCVSVCVFVNTINGLAPSYITDMLQPVSTLDRQVTLRSVDNNDLFVSRSRLRLGERAFHIAAARAWNSLPSDVKKVDTVKTFKND